MEMKAVVAKFKFKDTPVVINAPSALEREFVKLGFRAAFGKTASANTLVFINNKREFVDFLAKGVKKTEPGGVLWFAYAKGTSKVKTDVNRDILWAEAEPFGWRPVSAISIDETWSGLRFRPFDQVGK